MNEKYGNAEILDYWTSQAKVHGQSPSASWSDHHAIELEIGEISKRLCDGDEVLEVGCANGYSSVRFVLEHNIKILCIDYVPEMIEQARLRLLNSDHHIKGSIEFAVGDVAKLNELSSSYDKVISVRVLINLGTWERQLVGLRECIRVLKPGGMLLLSEATLQGWGRLNNMRREWGPLINTWMKIG
jgi:ubiquinone/menaquinone biosynthesis C-methylase UbiE